MSHRVRNGRWAIVAAAALALSWAAPSTAGAAEEKAGEEAGGEAKAAGSSGGALSHLIPWGTVMAPTPVGPVPLLVPAGSRTAEAAPAAARAIPAANATVAAAAAVTATAAAVAAEGAALTAAAAAPATTAPATAGTTTAAATAAGERREASGPSPSGDAGTHPVLVGTPKPASVTYESGGRRDPFRSLLLMATSAPELLDVGGAVLVGLARNDDQRLAMVEDAQGRVFALRAGDRVRAGRVAYIGEDRAAFDVWAYGRSERRVLTFKPKEGE